MIRFRDLAAVCADLARAVASLVRPRQHHCGDPTCTEAHP